MKLLALTQSPPWPPRSGSSLRNWAILTDLAAAHQVTLATFGNQADTAAPALRDRFADVLVAPARERTRAARLRSLLAGHADLTDRLASPAMSALLADVCMTHRFDGVVIGGLEMSVYLRPLVTAIGDPLIAYDAQNVEWLLQARGARVGARSPSEWPAAAYSAIQAHRLRTVERDVCTRADVVTCTSTDDATWLRTLAPDCSPVVLPNVVPIPDAARLTPIPETPNILFIGTMDFRPNVDAVGWMMRSILPRVRAAHPGSTLTVVGRNPPSSLTRADRDVRFTGAVDDVRPYLAGAAVCVAPLRIGGGTRLKVLEALAHRRPVVSTTLGIEGLHLAPGDDLLVADSADAFARAIVLALTNRPLADRIAAHGRGSVETTYSTSAISGVMAAALERARA